MGLKFGSRGDIPESRGVKFFMPRTDPVGDVFDASADDVGDSNDRFKGRINGCPDGELNGDGIPGRTLGPEPFCLGMMLTNPERLPGLPTGRS
jgi:hypothetical protein